MFCEESEEILGGVILGGSVVSKIACLLPAGRRWLGLGSNPAGIEFQ